LAKLTLNDVANLIGNPSSAQSLINANSATLEAALENTLSRNGATPNQMEADIDLNDNALLNVADPVNETDGVNLRSVRPLVEQFAGEIAETIIEGTLRVDTFTATALQTDFILTDSPGTVDNVQVFDNGLAMIPGVDYTLSGTDLKTLTFFVGRTAGHIIVARYTRLSPADSVLRADLANSAAGKGSALIAFKQSGTGAVSRTQEEKSRERVSVFDFIPTSEHAAITARTSVLDVATYIQQALDNSPAGAEVEALPGKYRIGATITVPAGKSLIGLSSGDSAGSGRVQFEADLAVTPIVRLNGGGASESVNLSKIMITRAAGTIPAASVGLHITSTDEAKIEDVTSWRSARTIAIDSQLGITLLNVSTSQATEQHLRLDGVVEVNAINCRFGRNGGVDLACGEYVRIIGTPTDTISFTRCQMNQSGALCNRAIIFENYTDPDGIVTFSQCHFESYTNFLEADATSVVPRFALSLCTLNGLVTGQFMVTTAAAFPALTVVDCPLINHHMELSGHESVHVSGNRIIGHLWVNGGSGSVCDNNTGAEISIFGACTGLAVFGNTTPGSAVTNIATGNVEVFGNITATAAVNNTLVNSFAGRYAKFGENLPYSVKRLTGVSDGAGIYSPAHGINIGNNVILMAMAYYKGGGGIMLPMNFVYIDAVNVQFNGATATTPARITLIYTDEANTHAW
jgi:hypothetical protein